MLKFVDYDIVFQEIPEEVTLAINISNCPNRCIGCHSPFLWDDVGAELNSEALKLLLEKYGRAATCLCFMGGDGDVETLFSLAKWLRENSVLKIGWYSGKDKLPTNFNADLFDYVKIGPYVEEFGNLKSPKTNQRLYKINKEGVLEDITHCFWK